LPKSTAARAGHDRLHKDLLAIAFLTLGAFLLAALVFSARGYEGFLTRALAQGLSLSLGVGAFGIPVVAFALAAFYGLEHPPVTPTRALVGVALLFMAVLTAVHIQAPNFADPTAETVRERFGYLFIEDTLLARGGYVGAAFAFIFLTVVGPMGSYIILTGLGAMALILITQGTMPLFIGWLRRTAGRGWVAANGGLEGVQRRRRAPSPRTPNGKKHEPAKRLPRGPVVDLDEDALPERVPASEPEPAAVEGPAISRPAVPSEPPPTAIPSASPPAAVVPDTDPLPGNHQGAASRGGPAEGPERSRGAVAVAEAPSRTLSAVEGPKVASGRSALLRGKASQPVLLSGEDMYQIPPAALLTEHPEEVESKEDRALAAENIIKLEDTLESFGIHAKVTHYERGPVLTRYEVEPERGIRVNQVARHTDDLRMALAAWDVRVEAPIPGKAAVGIEVPNKKSAVVGLRGLVESKEFREHPSTLAVGIGRDIAGYPMICDLVHMPHLLVAGATNSGKSVCLHSIVVSLLMRAKPSEVQLIMIDPKRVELNLYEGVPHLMAPVVHTVQQASDVLRKAIREMEKRYDQFARVSAANIAEYNFFTAGAQLAAGKQEIALETLQKRLKLDEAKARRLMDMMEWGGVVLENLEEDDVWRVAIDDNDARTVPLPRVVIVIDELADLMMQARAEFEFSICRIAQLARATGIHLVIATQRPSVKVVTGNIKANIPSRIALSVASQVDSRVILDGIGAERLIGRGDMLYAPIDASKPRRAQGSFVSRQEIETVVEYCRRQGEPAYSIIPEVPEEDNYSGDAEPGDDLYADAVRYVVSEDEASVSMLQRRFKVGYARAGRLIDMMAQRGVVGPSQGSKPRQVLIGSGYVDAALGLAPPAEAVAVPTSAFDDLPVPALEDTDELEATEGDA
jgi:DNA segregation ATPase FtsK/SpoIIIE-like protein